MNADKAARWWSSTAIYLLIGAVVAFLGEHFIVPRIGWVAYFLCALAFVVLAWGFGLWRRRAIAASKHKQREPDESRGEVR